MPILFFHAFFAAVLFSALFADVFFLRSPAAVQLASPDSGSAQGESASGHGASQLLAKWRKTTGWVVMGVVLVQLALGLAQWMPRMSAYPPAIFHTKFLLVVILVVLAKIRVFKERKAGIQIGLTRAMFGIFLVVFVLGIWSKL
jgi:hypothetical protein